MTTLTDSEEFLLKWLAQEDSSQYGECHGSALDGLIEKGLAVVGDESTGLNNTFIAKGTDIMYRAVTLTDAGHKEVTNLKGGT
jgi:hypothetical protein